MKGLVKARTTGAASGPAKDDPRIFAAISAYFSIETILGWVCSVLVNSFEALHWNNRLELCFMPLRAVRGGASRNALLFF